jgi:predicted AAA+ superfamily ATPase
MIPRQAAETIRRLSHGFPIVAITGPRQSGKTTLARWTFPDKPYVSLENPDARAFADSDPRNFLAGYPDGAILDEVQRCPELFSYLQGIVDEDGRMGLFVLTGSQQFGLRSRITQSLAGRVGMVQLLPFSHGELVAVDKAPADPETAMFTGLYPPLYDRGVAPVDWLPGYVATYLERDLHQLIQVRDLKAFQLFLRMCAARTGQLLNLSSLASDCGITHNTAKAWLSVLEASYIVFMLPPHFRNFNKRLTKSPKLYFYDTGLVSWLLGIQDKNQLTTHAMRGALFETWVIAELVKGRFNRGLPSNLYFWRDSAGNEVDVLVDLGEELRPIEVKSGRTIAADYFAALDRWRALAGPAAGPATLIYAGSERQRRAAATVLPWQAVDELAVTI